LCFQGFEQELAGLPGNYAPPGGGLLIGLSGNETVGCVAVRRLAPDICEMKRLYVKPQARGMGLGRQLAQQIITIAQELGYSSIRLDTLDKLSDAMRLYESLGFTRTGPYYDNPLPGVFFWLLDLTAEKNDR
jgi:ribosomal protein S18 acetylase RimI-like enzyme